jgi:putative ABC transport system permease protein
MNVLQDLHYALRQLRRAPGFALTTVLTLGLGIGASAAIFCLMDGIFLRPMQVPNVSRLVRVFGTTKQGQEELIPYPDYQAIAQRATAFQGPSAGLVAMGGRGSLMPKADGTSTLLDNYVVSDNFFSVLGVRPFLGRAFTPADAEQLREHPGLVLGYRCWQRNFGGDPQIVGRQIPLRHGRDQIINVDIWGVLPPTFRDVDPASDRDLWIPVETWAAFGGKAEFTSTEFRWFNLIGRLAPGATVAQANQQVAAIASTLATANPASDHDRGARAISDLSYRMSMAGTTGIVLLAIVGAVVLLCIVNTAHLLLARALTRNAEVALRISLGATRWTVARQLLVENLLLCAFGLAAGVGLAAILAELLPKLIPADPAMLSAPASVMHFQVDWSVFTVAALIALATALLLALVPLIQVAHPQLVPSLQASGDRATGRTPTLRRAAIWLQIGISFALLISTGALVRSFVNTRTQNIGLTRNQVLVAFTQDPDEPMRHDVLNSLRALPGVEAAAYGIRAPLMPSEGGIAAKVVLPNHPELREPVEIKYNAVSPDFLNVTGTRVLRGRGFTARDDTNGPPVVLISRTMAQKYWPNQDPIGQSIRLPGFDDRISGKGSVLQARIIGITEDAPINRIGDIPEPYMYLRFHLSHMGEVTYVIATRQNAMAMAQTARQVFIKANPLLDPMFVTSLPECIRASAGDYQMTAELASALGIIGLVLTIVGLYGFLAFRVDQRRREIGIRMALGATREATSRLILLDAAGMVLIGLALGVALAAVGGRLESSMLFGVRPLDLSSILIALGVLGSAALVASWIPARRAASIEPMQALRTE